MENNVELKEKIKELNSTFDMVRILEDQIGSILDKQIALWGDLMSLGFPVQMALEGMAGAAKSASILRESANKFKEVSKGFRELVTELEKGE